MVSGCSLQTLLSCESTGFRPRMDTRTWSSHQRVTVWQSPRTALCGGRENSSSKHIPVGHQLDWSSSGQYYNTPAPDENTAVPRSPLRAPSCAASLYRACAHKEPCCSETIYQRGLELTDRRERGPAVSSSSFVFKSYISSSGNVCEIRSSYWKKIPLLCLYLQN